MINPPKDPKVTTIDTIRDLIYRLKYPPSKGAYQVKVDDVMKGVEQLLIEAKAGILREAIDYINEEIDAGVPEEIAYRTVLLQIESDLNNKAKGLK